MRRFHECLEPGGTLLIDTEMSYADANEWLHWLKDKRAELPEEPHEPRERKRASDGSEYALAARLMEIDPLEQLLTYEMRAQRWRDGKLEAEETRLLTTRLYLKHELVLMLRTAGFAEVEVQGDHNDVPATRDDSFLVFVAR
jgi:hypothetical protein